MKKFRYSEATLSDLHPNVGPGLFIDPRARKSAKHLRSCCSKFLSSLPERDRITSAIPDAELKNELLEVARYYWSDADYENRVKRSKIKQELIEVRPALASLLCGMRRLSPLAKQAINIEIARAKKNSAFRIDDQFTSVLNLIRVMARANTSFVKPINQRPAGVKIRRACRNLIVIWEKISEQKFRKGFQSVAERSKDTQSPIDQFVNIDPQFVLVMLKAIDPSIKFETVRNGLREASRPPRKRREKVSASTPITS